MKTISVINLKGGVAKTTTSINMAAVLANEYGKRVLLIDNDKQGNTSRFFDKFILEAQCGSSRMLLGEEPVIWKIQNGLDLINANMTLEAAEYTVQKSQERQDNKYGEYLQKKTNEYDYIIIDNPPAVSMCVINALCASDEVIIPVKLDNWSLDGVEVVTEQIKMLQTLNKNLKIKGILITNFKKSLVNATAEEWLRKNCKYNVFTQKIRYSSKVDESTYYKQTLGTFSKTCAAAVDYKRLIQEYMESTPYTER